MARICIVIHCRYLNCASRIHPMNYSVYVLISMQNNSLYIGMTSKDPRERLKEHNIGSNKYTKRYLPYRLLYYEMGYCKSCSLVREKFLKSGKGREILKLLSENRSHTYIN